MVVPASFEQDTHELCDEEIRVRAWRSQQLEHAGYPAALSIILADDTLVDLHVATGLLEHGCDVPTAARILGWPL